MFTGNVVFINDNKRQC